jgi:hypothetical protein
VQRGAPTPAAAQHSTTATQLRGIDGALKLEAAVVSGGLLVARGKEKVWYNSVYSTTRSSPYYSLATPLLPVCGIFRLLDSVLYFPG